MQFSFKVDGHTYTLTTLTARESEEFLEFAKRSLPDPVDVVLATAAKLPETMREKFIEKHLDAAFEAKKHRGALTDPDVEAFAKTPAAVGKLFALMLRKHHPQLSDEQASDLVSRAVEEHGPDVFAELEALARKSHRKPMAEADVEDSYFRGGRLNPT